MLLFSGAVVGVRENVVNIAGLARYHGNRDFILVNGQSHTSKRNGSGGSDVQIVAKSVSYRVSSRSVFLYTFSSESPEPMLPTTSPAGNLLPTTSSPAGNLLPGAGPGE